MSHIFFSNPVSAFFRLSSDPLLICITLPFILEAKSVFLVLQYNEEAFSFGKKIHKTVYIYNLGYATNQIFSIPLLDRDCP